MEDTDEDSKTEEATPERRRKAREEGQFARSKDAGAVAAAVAAMVCMAALSTVYAGALREFTVQFLTEPFDLVRGDPRVVLGRVGSTLMVLALPAAVAAAIAGVAAGILEAGWHPNLGLAAPKWSRLDPISKLGQLFSPRQTAVNIALSLARVVVVALVAWWVLRDEFPTLMKLARTSLPGAMGAVVAVVLRLALWSSLALALLAVVDYAQSWMRHEKSIRMSRQELKDELHQQEGDPRVRARQRSRAREMLKRGIAKQLVTSDVVLTNPTHVSVALRYRMDEGAPVVTTKGYDEVALYIRKLAQEHGIPVVESPPLARALAAQVKAGRVIPMELYAAVAEVLAYVYRLKNRGLRA